MAPPRMVQPPQAPPEPPPLPNLPQNPFSDSPQSGGGFNPMPTASGPSFSQGPPMAQADPMEAIQRLLSSMGGYNPRF